MGQKDITEKLLEDYNDVFADIINGLIFAENRESYRNHWKIPQYIHSTRQTMKRCMSWKEMWQSTGKIKMYSWQSVELKTRAA